MLDKDAHSSDATKEDVTEEDATKGDTSSSSLRTRPPPAQRRSRTPGETPSLHLWRRRGDRGHASILKDRPGGTGVRLDGPKQRHGPNRARRGAAINSEQRRHRRRKCPGGGVWGGRGGRGGGRQSGGQHGSAGKTDRDGVVADGAFRARGQVGGRGGRRVVIGRRDIGGDPAGRRRRRRRRLHGAEDVMDRGALIFDFFKQEIDEVLRGCLPS